MKLRNLMLFGLVLTFTLLTTGKAWALGFELGETKEQLGLKYDVSWVDHGTGRVSITLVIADQGRLKPLTAVNFMIPSEDGTGFVDLSVDLETREVDGKLEARVHLKKEWAQRGQLQLRTGTLDGKIEPLTWYYHVIPIGKMIQGGEHQKPN